MSIFSVSGKIGSGKDTVGDIIRLLTRNVNGSGFDTSNWKVTDVINSHGWNPKHDKRIYKYEIKKFADKLKDIVCMLIGCTRAKLEDRDFKEKELGVEWLRPKHYQCSNYESEDLGNCSFCNCPPSSLTPRLLLQLLGTNCGRDIIHPNIWVNSLMNEYKSYSARGSDYEFEESHWIVTDTRFPNELKAVKDKGGISIRVNKENRIPCHNCQGGGCTTCNGYGYYLSTEVKGEHSSETALDDATFDYVIDNNGTIEELIEKVKEILVKEKVL